LSPFPTRVRLCLYAKGIAFETIEPSGFHGDTRDKGVYLDVNPIGRVPALELDDGRILPESEVICEYLEDAYPNPRLMPADPWGRAQVRMISRISDIYIVMAMLPLFNMVELPPNQWNQAAIKRHLNEIDGALGHLDEFIGTDSFAYGNSLTHADGTLVPILLLADEWLPIFRGEPLLPKHPKVDAYWKAIQSEPICARLIDETRTALNAAMNQ